MSFEWHVCVGIQILGMHSRDDVTLMAPTKMALKAMVTYDVQCSVFLIFFIMDENDSLSEYNKIPLGHNCTTGAVYYKIYFKVEICSENYIFDSHPTLHFPR